MFDRTLDTVKWNPTLRTQALEAVLYFAERDSVATRQAAATRAKSLVRKSMPYYLHASVPLLQSILHRVAGNLPKSEAVLRDFKRRGPSPSTRRDHALLGRLHIAQVETKIRCFDSDVNTFMYEWEPEQPLSTLDIEVKSRLQSTAARYFQSIGNFEAARASLEQHLSMSKSKPMRPLSRCVMVARLGDVYCELGQYERAEALLGAELAALDDGIRQRRPFRYLSLAWIEANIGLRKYRVAEDAADRLEDKMPRVPEDLHDQQQHMRRLIAKARVSHLVDDYEEAIARWKLCLDRMKQMETLQTTSGFIAATIYISSSHAHLASGDRDGGRRAWGTAVSILKEDTCNFWAPVVATSWLQDMVVQINKMQGWSLRIKMPGGQPDFVCP